jgi:hypothetical protein
MTSPGLEDEFLQKGLLHVQAGFGFVEKSGLRA